MNGILMLFEDPARKSTEDFYNPKNTKVKMTITGIPNQLYSQLWDEINKCCALTSKCDKETDKVAEGVHSNDTYTVKYLTNRYALWLDLYSTDENTLHGGGRRTENASVREQQADKF